MKMMCIVINCMGKNTEGIQTFKFPDDRNLKTKWLENLKLPPRKQITKWSRVCSRHFEGDCIHNNKIRRGAMPTLCVGHDDPHLHQSMFIERQAAKWVRKCSIQGCSTTSPPCITMFSFPMDKDRQNQWLKLCSLKEGAKHLKKKFICKEHFRDEDLGCNCFMPHALPFYRLHGDKENDEMPFLIDEIKYKENEDLNTTKKKIIAHKHQLEREQKHVQQQLIVREQQQRQRKLQHIQYQGRQLLQMQPIKGHVQYVEMQSKKEERRQQREQERRQQLEKQRQNLRQQCWEEHRQQLIRKQKHHIVEQQHKQPTFDEHQQRVDQKQELKGKCSIGEEDTDFRRMYYDIISIFGRPEDTQANNKGSMKKNECVNCNNEEFFRKQNFKLQQTYKAVIEQHLRSFKAMQKEKDNLVEESENRADNIINITGFVTEDAKIFAEIICNGNRKIYTEAQKMVLLNYYYHNRKGLVYMRDTLGFPLPTNSTIYRWSPVKRLKPGTNEIVVKALKAKTDTMKDIEKAAILSFDEIALRPELEYNVATDQIDGFVDDGRGNRTQVMAKKAMFFVVKGAFCEWKFTSSFHFTGGGYNGATLSKIISENLEVLEARCGFQVTCIISDQASANLAAYKQLHNTDSDLFFVKDGRKIYTLSDVPHCVKGFRNGHMKNDIQTPYGTASWNVYRETYDIDVQSKTARLLPKLTKDHLEPTGFKKMRVSLATQTYSNKMVNTIEFMSRNNLYKDPTNAVNAYASKCLTDVINKSFDVLNAKCNNKNCSEERIPVTRENNQLALMHKYRQEIMQFNVKGNSVSHKNYCKFLEAFPQMANGIFERYPELTYICPGRFNQDFVENLFSILRGQFGCNTDPSVRELQNKMGTYLSMSMVKKKNSSMTNCEDDGEKQLLIDWTALIAAGAIEIVDDVHNISVFDENVACESRSAEVEVDWSALVAAGAIEIVDDVDNISVFDENVACESRSAEVEVDWSALVAAGAIEIVDDVDNISVFDENVACESRSAEVEVDWSALVAAGAIEIVDDVDNISVFDENVACESRSAEVEVDWSALVAAGAIEICDQTDGGDDMNDRVAEKAAVRYFGGYGVRWALKKHKDCATCESYLTKVALICDSSQTFIALQNYGNELKLKNPSDEVFNVLVDHMSITSEIFNGRMEATNLRKQILVESVNRLSVKYTAFFRNDKCLEHRMAMVEHLTIVLLQKMCRWLAEKRGMEASTKRQDNMIRRKMMSKYHLNPQ